MFATEPRRTSDLDVEPDVDRETCCPPIGAPAGRVDELPPLLLFTHADDAKFAAQMPADPTPIAELAKRLNLDVPSATQRIWELVSVGLVEIHDG